MGSEMCIRDSGVYTTNPDEANIADDTRTGGGAFTLNELMSFEGALRGANFGGYPYESVFTAFEDMGDGTYDIRERTPNVFTDIFRGRDADGNLVPMNLAVYGERHSRAGEVLDPAFRNKLIMARLRGIDLSGGSHGPGGPGDNQGPDGSSGGDTQSGAPGDPDNDGGLGGTT